MKKDLEVYSVKKSKDDNCFVREAIDIIVNSETPADFFEKAEFFPVEHDYSYAFVAKGNVDTHFTGQAGQDRKEKYYSKNNKGQLIGDTKTVTDWYPISGSHLYRGTSFVHGSNDFNKLPPFSLDLLSNYEPYNEELGIENGTPIELSNENYETLEKALRLEGEVDTLEDMKNSYEKTRKLNYSSLASIDILEEYIIPIQEMRIKYGNADYNLAGFAIAGTSIKDELPKVSNDIDKEVKNAMHFKFTRPLIINLIITLIEIIILLCLYFNKLKIKSLKAFASIPYILSVLIVIQVLYLLVYDSILKKNRKNFAGNLTEKKKQAAMKVLAKYNL